MNEDTASPSSVAIAAHCHGWYRYFLAAASWHCRHGQHDMARVAWSQAMLARQMAEEIESGSLPAPPVFVDRGPPYPDVDPPRSPA